MKKTISAKRSIPFGFVLEELDPLQPIVKPMFGCFMVYLDEKAVLFLCNSERAIFTNRQGVWVATTPEHYQSLALEFSSTRSEKPARIGKSPWLLLPASAPDFEEQVTRACQLILERDPRIGRVPHRNKLRGNTRS
jgi:hypothetical protein